MRRQERLQLAKKRLTNVMAKHGIATRRTLEHKISDAGPYRQRIEPHIITTAMTHLRKDGLVRQLDCAGADWYYLSDTPPELIQGRLLEQREAHNSICNDKFLKRVGQSLEICVQRAMQNNDKYDYIGGFVDLAAHDDGILYKKEEPPSHLSGRFLQNNKKLDFLLNISGSNRDWAGVEIKNVRPWLYPNQPEVKDLLSKCIALDVVPVLIARRTPYITGAFLRRCGGITWQTLRQRYPAADEQLAIAARDKRLLGFADIRLGNEPDAPLLNFMRKNLPDAMIGAREKFEKFKPILEIFCNESIPFAEVNRMMNDIDNGPASNFHNSWNDDDWLL
ncbi:hypothetical protein HDIA_3618 [Hartmannibacter diazotrophicus]|uniref:Uncharacterized protein n=1 Tax=Hartmannibacter diazotrophicus TaxID=1482074 RepID=A0A2C9DAF7_9HYPH|nr:hypothetical protein [Hartmannibacter diazotrophicus]SON57159.1 hypothetical protein HDIA_3618 [Hartmannibacter diazotrophicus]